MKLKSRLVNNKLSLEETTEEFGELGFDSSSLKKKAKGRKRLENYTIKLGKRRRHDDEVDMDEMEEDEEMKEATIPAKVKAREAIKKLEFDRTQILDKNERNLISVPVILFILCCLIVFVGEREIEKENSQEMEFRRQKQTIL